MTENQIIEIAKREIQRIKESNNPYNDLHFINEIFGTEDQDMLKEVKCILKGEYKGQLNENCFPSNKSNANHLYNFLYENDCLSKYNTIAEYMDYPKVGKLFEIEKNSFEDNLKKYGPTYVSYFKNDKQTKWFFEQLVNWLKIRDIDGLDEKIVMDWSGPLRGISLIKKATSNNKVRKFEIELNDIYLGDIFVFLNNDGEMKNIDMVVNGVIYTNME